MSMSLPLWYYGGFSVISFRYLCSDQQLCFMSPVRQTFAKCPAPSYFSSSLETTFLLSTSSSGIPSLALSILDDWKLTLLLQFIIQAWRGRKWKWLLTKLSKVQSIHLEKKIRNWFWSLALQENVICRVTKEDIKTTLESWGFKVLQCSLNILLNWLRDWICLHAATTKNSCYSNCSANMLDRTIVRFMVQRLVQRFLGAANAWRRCSDGQVSQVILPILLTILLLQIPLLILRAKCNSAKPFFVCASLALFTLLPQRFVHQ